MNKLLLTLLGGFVLTVSASTADRPNLVFILADDLGWCDTTLYGMTKFYQTPNVERLAKRGMLFTQAYSASPLCSPTRASILTGQSPARIGITAPVCHVPEVKLEATVKKSAPAHVKTLICDSVTRLKPEYFTLAEALKQAGYATGHFGKWHLGSEPYSPLQQGFDVDVPHHSGPGPAGSFVAPWKFKDFKERTPGEHIEDRMADEAIAFMERNQGRPFFLNYWMFSVHAPFDAKKALIEKHRARVNPTDPQRSPTYAAMVESMDDAVGRLLDALDRLKLSERTAIVFFSDNGGNMYNEVDGTTPTSNAPLRGGKGNAFNGGVRVPCVVNWPGLTRPGSRSDEVIQSTDFYPTFLDLLKIQPQPGQIFDGSSITPALHGKALPREAIFTFFPHSTQVPDTLPAAVAVHAGDWKLIRLFHEGEKGAHAYRLYNTKEDVGEKNDLTATQPDRVKQLDSLIEKFLTNTTAVVPKPNPTYNAEAKAPPPTGKKAKKNAQSPHNEPAPVQTVEGTDLLQGWKTRSCEATVKNGVLTMTGKGAAPFLGLAAGKFSGPTIVQLRARSTTGGIGKVEWLPSPKAGNQAQSVPLPLKGGDWQQVRIELPATGPLGILRLYLPAEKDSVLLDWVELKSGKEARRWDF
jgi:arylsulfatase A-like enzyme